MSVSGEEKRGVRPVLALPKPADAAAVRTLVAGLRLPEPIAAILARRGYDTPEAAKAFLRPQLQNLHDPWSMADMERAVDRLSQAIDARELLLVHGDYDVDGVCGSALLVRALRELGARVEAFVPNRLAHGYDFGPAGLARAVEAGAGCVLTCDCGIMAHATVAAAAREGIDVVVTDHHTPPTELPPAAVPWELVPCAAVATRPLPAPAPPAPPPPPEPIRTVGQPGGAMESGGPVQTAMSPTHAAGIPPIKTVGADDILIGPPTWGTGPGLTRGQVCISPILAGIASTEHLVDRRVEVRAKLAGNLATLGELAGEQLEIDDSQGVDVRPRVGGIASPRLRSHIGQRSGDGNTR